jgi:predicted PurR-regulated permease PerM
MNTEQDREGSVLRVPLWLELLANWSARLLLIGAATFAVFWLALQVRIALIPLVLGVIAASTLRPLSKRLESFGSPKALAAAAPMAVVAGVIGAAGFFTYRETRSTLTDQQITRERIRTRIEEWLAADPFNFSQEQIVSAEDSVRSWVSSGVASFGTAELTLAVQLVAGGLLSFVLCFFVLKDGPMILGWAVDKVAPARRSAILRSGTAVAATLSAYVRSVLITGAADALLIGAGLWFLDVPLVLPLMLLTFFAALFPLVGAVVAGAAAAVVALITVDPTTALWVIALTIVVQQVEGNVLQPLIVSRQVSIHPVVTLLALTAGGAVAGLAGAFLAVPTVAAAIAAVRAFSSDMHADAHPDPESDPDIDVGAGDAVVAP